MKFIEIDLGLFGSGGEWEDYGYGLGTDEHKVSHTGIDIGALVKYPFSMNEKIALFPLLGITYRGFISTKMDGVKISSQEDLNAFWFKFGGGLDYSLSDKVYIRGEALYGFRFSNTFEDDMVDLFKSGGAPSADNILGHGIEIKFALGYRL
jgi:opacity protein-like surface antigen